MNKQHRFPFGEALACTQASESEETKIAANVSIVPLHTVLPGRARVHVSTLKGSPAHEHLLDQGLAIAPGVASAKANHLTGNVLLHFDPGATSLQAIIDHAAALLSGDFRLA